MRSERGRRPPGSWPRPRPPPCPPGPPTWGPGGRAGSRTLDSGRWAASPWGRWGTLGTPPCAHGDRGPGSAGAKAPPAGAGEGSPGPRGAEATGVLAAPTQRLLPVPQPGDPPLGCPPRPPGLSWAPSGDSPAPHLPRTCPGSREVSGKCPPLPARPPEAQQLLLLPGRGHPESQAAGNAGGGGWGRSSGPGSWGVAPLPFPGGPGPPAHDGIWDTGGAGRGRRGARPGRGLQAQPDPPPPECAAGRGPGPAPGWVPTSPSAGGSAGGRGGPGPQLGGAALDPAQGPQCSPCAAGRAAPRLRAGVGPGSQPGSRPPSDRGAPPAFAAQSPAPAGPRPSAAPWWPRPHTAAQPKARRPRG